MTRKMRALRAADHAIALAALCNLAYRRGLVMALAGNASCRVGDGYLATPSGCCLGEVAAQDLVRWAPGTGWGGAARRPTSEWALHAHIYSALPDAHAVLHTHSPHATALAVAGRSLPNLTPEIGAYLHPVPCLPFEPPGSDALGAGVAGAIAAGARAALLGGHGAVVWGATIADAFYRGELLEAACGLAIALEPRR